MTIFREKSTDANLKEISFLYSRLHLLLSDVAQSFVYWDLKQEGIILEAGKSSVEEAKSALLEIDKILAQLRTINRKFKFDKRVLENQYHSELTTCQIAIVGMVTELNTIWKHGMPSSREVPFGDTTNYKFVINHLVSYTDRANGMSMAINGKAENFNENNKDLALLPVLNMLTALSWARSL
jgi:hypothetical protein